MLSSPYNVPNEGCELDVSVVMPCLNEARTLGSCIRECLTVFHTNRLLGEVIIADNGSIDGCQVIASNLGATLVAVQKHGYGAALCAGFAHARSDVIVMADSDGSYDFHSIPEFLDAIDLGYDLVIGDRFRGNMEPNAMPLMNRYLGNPVLSFLGRVLFRSDVRDFHCGIRAFRREPIAALQLKQPGMEFASELVVKASLAKLRIGQIPVHFRKDGRDRPPHLRPWRDGWRHLSYLFSQRIRRQH